VSITQDGQTFLGYHGKIQYSIAETRLQRSSFPGVQGSSHIVSPSGDRELWTSYTITGFETAAELDLSIAEINQQVSELTGRVTVTGPFAGVFDKCTFVGFEVGEQFYDPGGHDWVARGRLVWIQRDPNTIPEE